MLRFNKLRWVRSALLLLAGGAGIVVGVLYANELAKIDPFARMRKQPESPLGQQIAMRLEDVDLWHYSEGKLVTTANVDRIDVHDSRQEISLFGVKNGAYKGDRGEFKYDAERAHWNAIAKRLEVSSGVRLRNKDMDLRTAGFTYSQESQVLSAPGQVSGTLNEGKLQASGFLYDMKEDTYRTGPTTWEGSVALFQDAGDTQRRPWRFKTDGITKPQGDVTTYENAEATDGEVIVKAPKLEYNRKTDVLVAHGPVKYYSAKANIVCNRATIYRRERRAMLTGAVDMLLKPEDQQKLEVVEIPPFKPVVPEDIAKNRPPAPVGQDRSLDQEVRDTSTVRRYPVAVTANQIEYWYGRGQRRAIITGQPQARQELPGGRWRYAWAHRATYDGEKEILRMISSDGKKDTRVKTSVGDDIVATWFEMSTKEGEDQWSASGLEGDVYPDDDDIPPRTTNPPPASLSGPIGGNRRRP